MITDVEIKIFNFENLGEVRVKSDEKGEPWFCVKDVCGILGLSNPSMAVGNLYPQERSKFNLGRQGNVNFVNESGVFAIILMSRKPIATKMRYWITSEVIPAIRKTGMYMTPETFTRALQNPDNLALIFENYARIIRENKNLRESFEEQQEEANELYTEVEELKTDLELETTYTSYLENTLKTYVSDSDDTLSMGEFAKLVALVDKKGNYLGRNLLLQALRKERYLMDKNVPYQKYINKGYFKIFSKNINGKEIVITRITSLGRNRIPTELQQKGYRVISKY